MKLKMERFFMEIEDRNLQGVRVREFVFLYLCSVSFMVGIAEILFENLLGFSRLLQGNSIHV